MDGRTNGRKQGVLSCSLEGAAIPEQAADCNMLQSGCVSTLQDDMMAAMSETGSPSAKQTHGKPRQSTMSAIISRRFAELDWGQSGEHSPTILRMHDHLGMSNRLAAYSMHGPITIFTGESMAGRSIASGFHDFLSHAVMVIPLRPPAAALALVPP